MRYPTGHSEPAVTADLIAEAAAWLAVLHGPNRTAATERGFQEWLKKSAGHARAFEEATGIWEESRNLPRPKLLHRSLQPQFQPRLGWTRMAAAAALALVAVGATIYVQQQSGVGTNVGEQRVLALDDGTRVILNTDTRVLIEYSRDVRRISLRGGEALFEVARDPDRPFVVAAGDKNIKALGTSFVVRREERQLAVTLVEGKVAVSSARDSGLGGESEDRAAEPVTYLAPGDRVVFAGSEPVKKDRPALEKLLAWQRREVAFDNAPLADAVTEMNRYNRKPLQIEVEDAANVRVTGLFRSGDSLSFARAVAEAYHLDATEQQERILLSGEPSAAPPHSLPRTPSPGPDR